jgi:hypothetical protein
MLIHELGSTQRQLKRSGGAVSHEHASVETWWSRAIFLLGNWFLSRAVIVGAIQVLAPLLSLHSPTTDFVPSAAWNLFTHWDGRFYRQIAEVGYDYVDDGQYHTVAFFPLYPLVTRLAMTPGLSFATAGTIVNSVALLAAMWQMYDWAAERYGVKEAKWSAAVMAWFPYSLFASVTYSEGVFLLTTTAALSAFDRGLYARTTIWGAMAAATRVPGALLIPALLLASHCDKRPRIAYIAALAAGAGLAAFILYCAVKFESPFAFLHAQGGWAKDAIYWTDAIKTIARKRGLALDSLLRTGVFVGAAAILWMTRARLSKGMLLYGWFSLLLFLFVNIQSIGRFVYGIASFSPALGIVLASHRRIAWCFLAASALTLVAFSVRWAWWFWVA